MLTRLRIRGFKNLLDVDLRFGPFTCIAGLNGAGKSNLFDAIRFVNLLTRHPLMEAVQMLRETKGRSPEPRSLFTSFQDYRAPELSFIAEMIVDREVQDDFGVPAEAAISTLRYELTFRLAMEAGAERLELAGESLKHISLANARREIAFTKSAEFKASCITGRRTEPFISTGLDGEITVHQEGHGGRKLPAPKSSRTVIGGMATSDFPTVLAAHKEMASWQTLLLEPSAMRAASSYQDSRYIDPRGANLPATIYRLQKQEARPGQVCTTLANKLAELIQDVDELRIRDDPKTETLTLEVRGKDGIPLPARSLSDGTLRFLVLATLGLDPAARGLICLEEPENGIHPERIPTIVRLLKEIAVDPKYPVGPDNPLRQVLVNTHSPEIVQNIDRDDLVFLDDQYKLLGEHKGRVAAVRIPDGTWRAQADKETPRLAPGRIASYLGNAAPREYRQGWLAFAQESIANP
jgi:predicted ATPase